jgi:hypothetical protein
MKEIPNNTAGAIVLIGHLWAKRPGESVRNARCLHRCTGDAHTRGLGKGSKKSDSASVWDPEPFTGRFRVIDLFFVLPLIINGHGMHVIPRIDEVAGQGVRLWEGNLIIFQNPVLSAIRRCHPESPPNH